jgi:hypothetical protein
VFNLLAEQDTGIGYTIGQSSKWSSKIIPILPIVELENIVKMIEMAYLVVIVDLPSS